MSDGNRSAIKGERRQPDALWRARYLRRWPACSLGGGDALLLSLAQKFSTAAVTAAPPLGGVLGSPVVRLSFS